MLQRQNEMNTKIVCCVLKNEKSFAQQQQQQKLASAAATVATIENWIASSGEEKSFKDATHGLK